ncbi:MAG: peptide-methionine (S)-S-oxide reductase MsrA [Deefgea sp.]
MLETTTLGGGCFWCLEAVFQQVVGVNKVASGYMGGHTHDPKYKQICRGDTGHAEVVHIEFDSTLVTFEQLLDIFFVIHDPTTLNQQGNDIGTQYRSVIFTNNSNQQDIAIHKIASSQADLLKPIVTEVLAACHFWPAEPEHHNYYSQHALQPYCRAVVEPKLRKFLQQFPGVAK